MNHLELPGHKCVLGMTGSGKSYAVKAEIRAHKGGVLVLDPKNEGDWPCYYLSGAEDLRDMYGALKRGAHLAYVPDRDREKAGRLVEKVCNDLLDSTWGDLWLVVDEADIYAGKQVPSPLEWIAQRGRSQGVKGVWITQRPAGLNHILLTQADHHLMFWLGVFEWPYFEKYKVSGEDVQRRLGAKVNHRYLLWDQSALTGPFRKGEAVLDTSKAGRGIQDV